MEFDLDKRHVTVLVETGRSFAYAMEYDYKNRFVYFPRYQSIGDILRCVKFVSTIKEKNVLEY